MRVLIATDGGSHSDLAVQSLPRMLTAPDLAITLLTVIHHEEERPAAEALLARGVELLGVDPALVDTVVGIGEAAAEIARLAEEGEYDLLVVGEKSSHGFLRRLLGTAGENVIAHAPCPVLIVKQRSDGVRHMLVCASGANYQGNPSSLVARWAGLFAGGQVTILHVMSQISALPDQPLGWQLQADAGQLIQAHAPEGEMLDQSVEQLAGAGFRVQAKVRHGLVVDEVGAEANEGDYDLVVIGAHQTAGWRRFLLDDLARQIIAGVDRSILVTPAARAQE